MCDETVTGESPGRLPYAQGDVLACFAHLRSRKQTRGALLYRDPCDLVPEPFINADILSPQIQSQIVKLISCARPKTNTHTHSHTRLKKTAKKTFPLFCPQHKKFLCHLSLLELSESPHALMKAVTLHQIKSGGFPPPFGLSASQSSRQMCPA